VDLTRWLAGSLLLLAACSTTQRCETRPVPASRPDRLHLDAGLMEAAG
jgi:hypothetical protein